MSEQNKALVRRFYEEVFQKKNVGAVEEFFSPSAVIHAAPPEFPQGAEGVKQLIGMFLLAFPDLDFTESHQMLIDWGGVEERYGLTTEALARRLEAQDIIVDAMCRLGTSELTRRGMVEADMGRVAELVLGAAAGEEVRAEVNALASATELAFTLED